jgi:hypothetical protein
MTFPSGIPLLALPPPLVRLAWGSVCSLTQRFSRMSFEKLDRETEKGITVSLGIDPKPDEKDPNGGAA